MQNSILNSLGLTNHEKDVYIYLLKNGLCSPTQIENGAKIHRPIVYKSIESLLEKGLISVSPTGKRNLFKAEPPEKLESLFKELESKYLSELEDFYSWYEIGKSEKPEITFNKGRKAVENSYMDIVNTLKKDEKYFRYLSTSPINREKYIPKGYREKREKKGLERLIITSKKTYKENKKLGLHVKVLPENNDFLDDNYGQVIYGNKVAIVDFESEFVTTIKSQKYAKFQEKLFKTLFERL
jgi:HTH-type transcriptional regulator, sugar sensing transcriptional regulator